MISNRFESPLVIEKLRGNGQLDSVRARFTVDGIVEHAPTHSPAWTSPMVPEWRGATDEIDTNWSNDRAGTDQEEA